MSTFSGMEELLQDFLTESSELLSDVDQKLVDLEKRPSDGALLNEIFRGFHTIKGGAGFLNAIPLVNLCHRTENLFDKLRNGELHLNSHIMDAILNATGTMRDMFDTMMQNRMPEEADENLIMALDAALSGQLSEEAPTTSAHPTEQETQAPAKDDDDLDWFTLYTAIVPEAPALTAEAPSSEPTTPAEPNAVVSAATTLPEKRQPETQNAEIRNKPVTSSKTSSTSTNENTIRIDTARLDMVLNLSGEIGLTKNRLTTLRTDILQGRQNTDTLRSLDEAINQLDLLVSDLQNAVMKTRMQPIGRLFQKYPRMARDLARQLGKEVELILSGEETELDKTMIEELNDPLVHLVRNAVDHGIESPAERLEANKNSQAYVKLSAEQVGDHIKIEITDDGKGMDPNAIRQKAIEKGLIDQESANALDEKQCLQLIFIPGFSTRDQISSVSGRGVGMDVVRTNILNLNGRIDIHSAIGEGTRISIALPLTLAILPVLVVRACNQSFAIPLSMVREIITITPNTLQEVSGRPTIVLRDKILPLKTLSSLLDWESAAPAQFGVCMQLADKAFVLAVESFVGRDDVVIKPLQNIHPKGVAGATLSGEGSVVIVLDIEELLNAIQTP